MKTKIAAFFLLFSVQYLGAENYLTDSTVWTEYGFKRDPNPTYVVYKEQSMLMGDTIIKDKTYKKLYHDLWYSCAIRESEGKVYGHFSDGYLAEFDEVLMYDFSVQKGDTIRNIPIHGSVRDFRVVLSVDTITLENGIKRKRIYTSLDEWIEGIGSVDGFLFHSQDVITCCSSTVQRLVCFKQKDTILYSHPELCFGDCCTFTFSSVQIKTANVSEVDVVLNAKEKKLEIALSNNGEVIESVRLIDVSGVVIQNYKINSFGKINLSISALKSGLYFVCISSEKGRYTKKISL